MKKQDDKLPHHPHTKFFEAAFSNETVAYDFITQILPKAFVKNLILDDLKIIKGSFLTKDLSRRMADVLYECTYGNNKQTVRIQFLMEHKSVPEPFSYFQFLTYQLEIWRKQKLEDQPLTPIIPILFYHGEKNWNRRKFEDMFELVDQHLRPYLPSFEYYLVDLSKYSDEQILNLKHSFLINALLTFKHYRQKSYILEKIELIFSLTLKKHEWNLYESQFRYITWNHEFSAIEQQEIINKVQEPVKNTIMSTYEALIQKGEKIGIEKGIEKGEKKGIEKTIRETVIRMDEKGLDLETISSCFNISKERVKEILKNKA